MNYTEFSDQFDVLYNNITSNQAPGLTEYEKSVFLTKAQNEIVKNYFTANSKGNTISQGFDDSALRQADFTSLIKTSTGNQYTPGSGTTVPKIDSRSVLYTLPADVFIVINEKIGLQNSAFAQVIPLRYDEYTRLMSKPFKRPLKNQAWRLINSVSGSNASSKIVEIIPSKSLTEGFSPTYSVRYIRKPKPIIVGDLDGLTIDGYSFGTGNNQAQGCELDSILHEDILQRAVELAKVAWTQTGQDNTNAVLAAGQRSE